MEIQCGLDVLSIKEVKLEGKKQMEVGEFLRGVSLKTGAYLGLNK